MGRIKKEPTPKCADSVALSKYTPILQGMQEGTQNYLVLQHMLTYGSITPSIAYRKYRILALHSRISDLRNRYMIPVEKKMRSKNGKVWGEYFLKGEE